MARDLRRHADVTTCCRKINVTNLVTHQRWYGRWIDAASLKQRLNGLILRYYAHQGCAETNGCGYIANVVPELHRAGKRTLHPATKNTL